jgi:crotonobetainyl-CoA:carnitine CoA-transferase CaiB-like acyl-CoA transferase
MSVDGAARRPPLGGVRVVGLEHSVAGPLCTRILGDLGADVVKVERAPHGDFARHWDANVHGECSQFWWLNRGKRSVVLDLKDTAGRSAFDALLARADVFVCNLSPGAVERLGLTPELVESAYPRLVACQISGYGREGALRDRKAYDMLVQAEAGVMSLTGTPDTPSRAGVSISDVGTGMYAAGLVMAALLGRASSGRGAFLDVAMYDATLEYAAPMLLSYLNAGVLYPRLPDRHHAIAPYGVFRCADGVRLLIAIEHDSEWRQFAADVIGRPELGEDPRYATNVERLANRDEVDAATADALGALESTAAERLLDEHGFAYAFLNDMEAVGSHPVVAERGIVADVDGAAGWQARTLIGMAERLFATHGRRGRPPELGEDTEDVLAELGLAPGRAAGSADATATR